MSDQRIKVVHRKTGMRGQTISGPSGRIYLVHRETGQLHLTEGSRFSSKPGVLPQDAAEYAKFPDDFRVAGSKKSDRKPPKRFTRRARPPRRSVEEEEDTSVDLESETEERADEDEDEEEEIALSDDPYDGFEFPEDMPEDKETKSNWIDWATEVGGVDLTASEKKKNKDEVIDIIKRRFIDNELGEE